jgi:acid phosphatase
MGNHERESPLYFDAFYFPGNKRWYSFDYGNVHFIALYAERAAPEEEPWLKNDLAQTRQPWKVVFLHYPLYSSGHHGGTGGLRKELEPLLIQYGVDLVFCGHDHDYERFVVNNIVYIVDGGGGGSLYQAEHPDPASAYFTSTHSSVLVAVNGLQLNIAGVRSDGVRFDQFALRKARPADRAVVIR